VLELRGGAVQVNSARPSVDPRYALGLCEHCSRFAKPRGGERPDGLDPSKLQPLVRAKDWDADAFAARRQAERERRVIAHPRNEAEHEQRSALLARFAAEAAERRGGS
jgi:hypothetical protein